ncbi:MAG: GNAT family N-acetyltransferase [Bacillota bacterium]
MGKNLAACIETPRLMIRAATKDECEALQRICNAGSYIAEWTGDMPASDHIATCLSEGDLPPVRNADLARYALKSIYLKATMEIIGYVDLYHGYPDDDTLWLSMLMIHPDYQRQSYGQEIVTVLTAEAKQSGYHSFGIGVHLKNWPALRFWVKHGFSEITGIYGDRIIADGAFALVGLRKVLA